MATRVLLLILSVLLEATVSVILTTPDPGSPSNKTECEKLCFKGLCRDTAQVMDDTIPDKLFPGFFKSKAQMNIPANATLKCADMAGFKDVCRWVTPGDQDEDCANGEGHSDQDSCCPTCHTVVSDLDPVHLPNGDEVYLVSLPWRDSDNEKYQLIPFGICGKKHSCRICEQVNTATSVLVSNHPINNTWDFLIYDYWWQDLEIPSYCKCVASSQSVDSSAMTHVYKTSVMTLLTLCSFILRK